MTYRRCWRKRIAKGFGGNLGLRSWLSFFLSLEKAAVISVRLSLQLPPRVSQEKTLVNFQFGVLESATLGYEDVQGLLGVGETRGMGFFLGCYGGDHWEAGPGASPIPAIPG